MIKRVHRTAALLAALCVLFAGCALRIGPKPRPAAPEASAWAKVITADAGGTVARGTAPDSGEIPEGWRPQALLGQWHAMDMVAAGYGERWMFESDGAFAHAPSDMDSLNRLLCEYGTWELGGDKLRLTVRHRIMLSGGTVGTSEEGEYLEGADIVDEPVVPAEIKTITVGGFANAEYGDEAVVTRATVIFDGVTYYDFSSQPDMFAVYFEYATKQ